MKQVSALMHDQIDRPLDRAVYWIEYVSRHGGAPHLRSPSRRLAFFQRGLVDVIVFVLLSALILAYLVYRLALGFRYLLIGKSSVVSLDKKLN